MQMLTAALFTTTKHWGAGALMSSNQQMYKKLWHIPTLVYKLAIKNHQEWIHAVTRMNLKGALLSERSHLCDVLEKAKHRARTNQGLPGGWDRKKSLTAKGEQEESFGGNGTIPHYG